jgi:hypothetical protein
MAPSPFDLQDATAQWFQSLRKPAVRSGGEIKYSKGEGDEVTCLSRRCSTMVQRQMTPWQATRQHNSE